MLSGMSSRISRLKRLYQAMKPLPMQTAARKYLTWTRSARPGDVRRGLTSGGRGIAWWGPPRQGWDDEDDGDGRDKYVYRMKLEQGGRVEYDVKVEGREVVVRGRVVDSSPTRRYEHTFSRTHMLPEDVDLSTVRLRFNPQGDLVITARFYK